MKLFFLNGLKRSGKDTTADILAAVLGERNDSTVAKLKAATPLYDSLPVLFGIDRLTWDWIYANEKETSSPELCGMTPREAMIWLSEDVMKPRYGKDHFGRVLGRRIRLSQQEGCGSVVVSDSGFIDEVKMAILASALPIENIYLVRIERVGTCQGNDSRQLIDWTDVGILESNFRVLKNDSDSKDVLEKDIRKMVQSFCN